MKRIPGAFINVGIGDTDGPFHSPRYEPRLFRDFI
jgi:hypothetical protein